MMTTMTISCVVSFIPYFVLRALEFNMQKCGVHKKYQTLQILTNSDNKSKCALLTRPPQLKPARNRDRNGSGGDWLRYIRTIFKCKATSPLCLTSFDLVMMSRIRAVSSLPSMKPFPSCWFQQNTKYTRVNWQQSQPSNYLAIHSYNIFRV